MTQIQNHKVQVVVDADAQLVIDELVIEFDITKDLEDEPNEATITIYNLEASKRNIVLDPTYQDLPVDLYITPHLANPNEEQEFVLAFRGEIDRVENIALRPGYATVLHCMSQKEHHKSRYIDGKTYASGTALSQIFNDFITAIDLPSETLEFSPQGIRKARSFTGPAYELLQELCYDSGYKVYIRDGTLYVSSVYEPYSPIEYSLSRNVLLEPPKTTERVDSDDVEMRTIVDTTAIDPFAKQRKRKKKCKKIKIREKGKFKYVRRELNTEPDDGAAAQTIDAIDAVITGADFHAFADPTVNPDYLVSLTDDPNTKYRVREVRLWGDNDGGDWDMLLKTDDFDDFLSNA